MLKGAIVPRLSHILKSIQKNQRTAPWIKEMDIVHLSTWLHCLTSPKDLENDMEDPTRELLGDLLDLPPSYGGAGLHSLENDADEEFLGSYAGITSSLKSFSKRT